METAGLRKHGWTAAGLTIAIVMTFSASVYTARITGHWQSSVSVMEFRHHLKRIDSPQMTHPSVSGKRPAPSRRMPGMGSHPPMRSAPKGMTRP